MKNTTSFLLEQYRKMSGEKKVKLAMQWSEMVREVSKAGRIQTKAHASNKSTRSS